MTVVIYGYKGFVGQEIWKRFELSTKDIIGVERSTFNIMSSDSHEEIELVIHCANSAKRFRANNNPKHDYNQVISVTQRILERHINAKKILISSISCRTEKSTPYGQNRLAAEELWLANGGMVIRLGPLYGGNREQDTLHDIVRSKHVYVSKKTKYAYSSVEWNAKYIQDLANTRNILSGKVLEIGAKNTISLEEISDYVDSKSTFGDRIDDQYPRDFFNKGPDAYNVLHYAKSLIYG